MKTERITYFAGIRNTHQFGTRKFTPIFINFEKSYSYNHAL